MQQLSEDEFDQQFTVVPDAQGDAVRPQADGIPDDSRHLWTIVEAEGSLYALSGLHCVNRIGYILTEEAWGQETEALWYEASDDNAGDDSPSSMEAAA
jgi:hypothetical protein